MNHLYGQMNIEKVACRYESKIHDYPLLSAEHIDGNHLRDQVQVLLHNDSPSTLVSELFSLPSRNWHDAFKSSSAPTHGFSCGDISGLNPANTDFNVNYPMPSLTRPGYSELHKKCLTPKSSQKPILPIKHRTKVDISILRKQHRLVQLGHAAICTNDAEKIGPCRKSRHCAKLKKLWCHLSVCHDDKCKVQHCFSSRYILGHYCKCKDSKCVVCEPARRQAMKYEVLNTSDLPLTNIMTTTISENDSLTKDSSSERLQSKATVSHDDFGGGNSIYITNLRAFASDEVTGDTVSNKRHSLSSISALSPPNGDKHLQFEPNDDLDVAFFLSRLKQQDA